jgi:TRAP-type C4-dicarboxylate transport system permease small subunit
MKLYNNFEGYLLAYSILILATLTVLQIIARTFFDFGFGWLEQVGGHTLVMITLLGASIAVKKDKHFKMGALIENLSKQTRHLLGIFTNLLCGLFFTIIVYEGFIQTFTLYKYGTKTAALSMPFFIVYLPIPIFSISICVRYGIASYNDFKALTQRKVLDQ